MGGKGCVPHRPKKVGACYLLCGEESASGFPFHCLVGPQYPCMLVTYCLIIVPSVVVFIFVAPSYPFYIAIMLAVSFTTLLCAFSFTACSDPGIIYAARPGQPSGTGSSAAAAGEGGVGARHEEHQIEEGTLCGRCEVMRPDTAQHCGECNLCIDGLDHHCPWTGKCIGKRNLAAFYVFVGSVFLHLGVVLLLVMGAFAQTKG